jgi:predicted alpha/beta-fold hydrolase
VPTLTRADPDDFRPLPLLGNPHLQTVLGLVLGGRPVEYPSVERTVTLPDGDRLLVADATPPGWKPGGRVAVLVHGLSGSALSTPVQRLGGRLLPFGFRTLRVNLRGNWQGIALARGSYHAGSWRDVLAVVLDVLRDSPGSPVTLVGYSLGGNLVLKLAGEAPTGGWPWLERVAAVAPPIDLEQCVRLIGSPQNRHYDRYFVRDLVRRARARARLFPDLPPLRLPYLPTARVWDELYTAPRNGFADALDYYRQSSAGPVVARIAVPTLILTARNDPFVGPEPFERLKVPEHIRVWLASGGGHLGFIGWDGAGGLRWSEERVLEFLTRDLSPPS